MHARVLRIANEILFQTFFLCYNIATLTTYCIYLPIRRYFFRDRFIKRILNYFEHECLIVVSEERSVYIAVDSLQPIEDKTIVQDVTICFRILDHPPVKNDVPHTTQVKMTLRKGIVTVGESRCVYNFSCINSFNANIRGFKEFVLQSVANRDRSHIPRIPQR